MARILIIDDNADMRDVLHEILARRGHEIDTARDGDVGLRRFDDFEFDLVITDMFMPKKDGLETIKHVLAKSPHTPIIAISGSLTSTLGFDVHPDYLKMAATFGARTLAKPFGGYDLLALVRECLEGSDVLMPI
jgi:DNA-binding response OmpR family regulator